MGKASSVGELVRQRRATRGIGSQQRLAEIVGIDRSHIAKIESGTIALPQPELRKRLGEVLGLTEVDFLTAAGWLGEEHSDYSIARDPDEHRLRSILSGLPPEDQALLVEFAELLDRRHRERRK